MLSKQEDNSCYQEEVERYQALADEEQRRLYRKYIEAVKAPIQPSPPPPTPTFRNAERATLACDGIVIEAKHGMERMVVRGDLLKTLATLVTMAQMAGLLVSDEDQTKGV